MGQMDAAQKGLYGFLALCALMMGVFWVGDRISAVARPEQYAARKAAEQAERNAASARHAAKAATEREKEAAEQRQYAREQFAFEAASEALNSVKASLRDPSSAQFQNVWAVEADYRGATGYFACGQVNSRNGYGAYTGFAPFVAHGGHAFLADDRLFAEIWSETCAVGKPLMRLNP